MTFHLQLIVWEDDDVTLGHRTVTTIHLSPAMTFILLHFYALPDCLECVLGCLRAKYKTLKIWCYSMG